MTRDSRIRRSIPGVLAGLLLLGALAWPLLQPVADAPAPNADDDDDGEGTTIVDDPTADDAEGHGATPGEEPADVAPPLRVMLQDGRLLVDGTPSDIVRCVGYQPAPPGVSPAFGYRWANFPENYEGDLPLLADLGANTIAINTRAASEPPFLRTFMSRALEHGLHVILVIDGPYGKDPGEAATRAELVEYARASAEAYADHPALLAWQVGIEMDYVYRDSDRVEAWYSLLEEVTRELHALDANHLVFTANNPVTATNVTLTGNPSADLYGINFYGLTRGGTSNYLTSLAQRVSGYPVFVTEFGVDALDNRTLAEDLETQASVLTDAWSGIEDAHRSGAPVLGGCVHEWSDQWWKGGTPDSHDPTPVWTPDDKGVLSDDTFNEEWFGLVAVTPGSTERELRQAYHSLRGLWATA